MWRKLNRPQLNPPFQLQAKPSNMQVAASCLEEIINHKLTTLSLQVVELKSRKVVTVILLGVGEPQVAIRWQVGDSCMRVGAMEPIDNKLDPKSPQRKLPQSSP